MAWFPRGHTTHGKQGARLYAFDRFLRAECGLSISEWRQLEARGGFRALATLANRLAQSRNPHEAATLRRALNTSRAAYARILRRLRKLRTERRAA